MVKNMSVVDRVIRIVLALVVVVFTFTGMISGPAAIVLGVLAVVFLLTGAVGTCPLYMLAKFSTKGSQEEQK
jgi:hypothetical protein